MNQTALIIQSIVSLILVILILLQERGTALGSAFGGGGESYSTRRGIQKNIYLASIVLAVVFIALALYNLMA
ncbi:MAG: preprotein translocase subunit SecG [Candidatus Paceibacterota bacterium]|jgi:preprotein translocase subunit SecG|nr:preprotein translocase subunit SecG [Candidatus Paceibacterota bacterium]MDD5555470.1 preprotein translocase subunit SecG [Candidatus Paceibacterota bacterium]